MLLGRPIRARAHRRDPDSAIYPSQSRKQTRLSRFQDCPRSTNNEYEDLGHVTDARLNALRLQAGQFART